MVAPSVTISGHWDVSVEFFSSTSQHTLFIEQDGNWIQGTHHSDFNAQEVMGVVEGDQVKLRSNLRIPGNGVTYLFSGTDSGDAIIVSICLAAYTKDTFS